MRKKINWYFGRFKTMSIPELFYRIHHIFIDYTSSFRKGKRPNNLKLISFNNILKPSGLKYAAALRKYRVFDKNVNLNGSINWHFDIHSKKEFPKVFTPRINTRGFDEMSAKHVWEINRLLFLPIICIKFIETQNEEYLRRFISIMESWSNENPYLIGINWHSNIELSIRLINWAISWEILNASELIHESVSFRKFVNDTWIPCIYQHCKRIHTKISHFSSGNNHLIAELTGLFVSSTLWKFKESKKWSKFSKKGLEKEILKQHTTRGINREQASMYIHFITDFFLISSAFAKKSNNDFSSSFYNCLNHIFNYIFQIIDIKGNIIRYGDEDDGHVLFFYQNDLNSNYKSLLTSATILFSDPKLKSKSLKFDQKNLLLFGSQAEKIYNSCIMPEMVRQGSMFFTKEGHFILRKMEFNREILLHYNAAPLGYLSIAAHGHADALSFVFHLDGDPIIVDNGTYTYHTESEYRKYFKGTLAHNTVRVNHTDQATYIGPSLWRNPYSCEIIKSVSTSKCDEVTAKHTGYVKQGITHTREIKFDKINDVITIWDFISIRNNNIHTFEFCLHLFPDIPIHQPDENTLILNKKSKRYIIVKTDPKLNHKIVHHQQAPLLGYYSKSFRNIEGSSVLYSTVKTDETFRVKTEIHIKSNKQI